MLAEMTTSSKCENHLAGLWGDICYQSDFMRDDAPSRIPHAFTGSPRPVSWTKIRVRQLLAVALPLLAKQHQRVPAVAGETYWRRVVDATSASKSPSSIRIQFDELATRWERETRNLSSPQAMASHPAYAKIIRLGNDALPLIFERMERQPGFWFEALRRITGEDPVQSAQRGNVDAMWKAWVKWGTERGHI